jgi:cytochrome c oxidase assembly protein subunit 15
MDLAAPLSAESQDNRRNIAIWLLICCGMVVAMVIIGGITRLTESGLSMTEWRPLVGWIPPLSEAEWQRIFDRYRQTSEYKIQFPDMDLAGFKTIFWWEYIHRVWGRLIGLVFALPLLWFVVRGRIERALIPHLVALLLLGGLQGVIGWWMVVSGFVDRDDVSQYRLTTHLGMAVLILGYLLWVALGLLSRSDRIAAPAGLRSLSRAVTGIAFVTILSGGLVAGINAGFIHNTWPLMDGGLLPDDFAALTPFWLNLFETHATVQFDHRILAYLTAILAAVFWVHMRGAALHARAHKAAHLLGAAVVLQLVLGVVTLVLVVPIVPAVLHQAGAVTVFVLALWCAWELSAKNSENL